MLAFGEEDVDLIIITWETIIFIGKYNLHITSASTFDSVIAVITWEIVTHIGNYYYMGHDIYGNYYLHITSACFVHPHLTYSSWGKKISQQSVYIYYSRSLVLVYLILHKVTAEQTIAKRKFSNVNVLVYLLCNT